VYTSEKGTQLFIIEAEKEGVRSRQGSRDVECKHMTYTI